MWHKAIHPSRCTPRNQQIKAGPAGEMLCLSIAIHSRKLFVVQVWMRMPAETHSLVQADKLTLLSTCQKYQLEISCRKAIFRGYIEYLKCNQCNNGQESQDSKEDNGNAIKQLHCLRDSPAAFARRVSRRIFVSIMMISTC